MRVLHSEWSFCFLGGWGFQLLWFGMWAFEDLGSFEFYHLGECRFSEIWFLEVGHLGLWEIFILFYFISLFIWDFQNSGFFLSLGFGVLILCFGSWDFEDFLVL